MPPAHKRRRERCARMEDHALRGAAGVPPTLPTPLQPHERRIERDYALARMRVAAAGAAAAPGHAQTGTAQFVSEDPVRTVGERWPRAATSQYRYLRRPPALARWRGEEWRTHGEFSDFRLGLFGLSMLASVKLVVVRPAPRSNDRSRKSRDARAARDARRSKSTIPDHSGCPDVENSNVQMQDHGSTPFL